MIKKMAKEIGDALLAVLYPETCHCCGAILSVQEKYVCNPCLENLPLVSDYEKLWEKFAGQKGVESVGAMYRYTSGSPLSGLFQDFKYRGYEKLAHRLGYLAGNDLRVIWFFNNVDIIVPVPLHWFKRVRRGYNQAEAISRGLSDALGVKCVKLLYACKPHSTQTGFSASQRKENVKGIFRCKKSDKLIIGNNVNIAIIDDVCTTGATLAEAARAITECYPQAKIRLFSLAATFTNL